MSQLKLIWDGKFKCENMTGFSFNSFGRRNAMRRAIQSYLVISGQINLIKDEQIQSLI